MIVLDASAVLAFLQGETGGDAVEQLLIDTAHCGAANYSEVAQQVRGAGRDWDLARSLLDSYGLLVQSVTRDDAEWAAQRWVHGEGLSLGDRMCLALGDRLDATIWTADRKWGTTGRVRQIR